MSRIEFTQSVNPFSDQKVHLVTSSQTKKLSARIYGIPLEYDPNKSDLASKAEEVFDTSRNNGVVVLYDETGRGLPYPVQVALAKAYAVKPLVHQHDQTNINDEIEQAIRFSLLPQFVREQTNIVTLLKRKPLGPYQRIAIPKHLDKQPLVHKHAVVDAGQVIVTPRHKIVLNKFKNHSKGHEAGINQLLQTYDAARGMEIQSETGIVIFDGAVEDTYDLILHQGNINPNLNMQSLEEYIRKHPNTAGGVDAVGGWENEFFLPGPYITWELKKLGRFPDLVVVHGGVISERLVHPRNEKIQRGELSNDPANYQALKSLAIGVIR